MNNIPRRGYGFACPLFLANAIYASIPEPVKIQFEKDLIEYKDRMDKEELHCAFFILRNLEPKSLWLIPKD